MVGPGEVAAHQSSRDEGAVHRPSVVSRRCIGYHVTAMCDNSTVVAYVNKQGGMVSRALCLLASHLLRWMESLDIHLNERYLSGQANVLADLLSCRGQVVGTEWSLHPQVARSLLRVVAIRRSTFLRRASMRNCPFIIRSSQIPRLSSRMRFVIFGTTWTCTRSLPFLRSVG